MKANKGRGGPIADRRSSGQSQISLIFAHCFADITSKESRCVLNDSKIILVILFGSVLPSEPDVRADELVLVVSEHRIQVVLRGLGQVVDRTRELLMLKVDLAVSSVPAFQHQGVRREA